MIQVTFATVTLPVPLPVIDCAPLRWTHVTVDYDFGCLFPVRTRVCCYVLFVHAFGYVVYI